MTQRAIHRDRLWPPSRPPEAPSVAPPRLDARSPVSVARGRCGGAERGRRGRGGVESGRRRLPAPSASPSTQRAASLAGRGPLAIWGRDWLLLAGARRAETPAAAGGCARLAAARLAAIGLRADRPAPPAAPVVAGAPDPAASSPDGSSPRGARGSYVADSAATTRSHHARASASLAQPSARCASARHGPARRMTFTIADHVVPSAIDSHEADHVVPSAVAVWTPSGRSLQMSTGRA